MEPQTRFNLSAALQTWRADLAAQPNLTPETRRELETHVTDTVAEMQQRGLNDEESFWLARRRVGQPKELDAEFTAAEPTSSGHKWMLSIAIAFYVLDFCQNVAAYSSQAFTSKISQIIGYSINSPRAYPFAYLSETIIRVLAYLVVASLGIYATRNHFGKKIVTWRSFDPSRHRLLVVYSFLLILAIHYSQFDMVSRSFQNSVTTYQYIIVLASLPGLVWSLILATLIFWLSPTEKSPALERA